MAVDLEISRWARSDLQDVFPSAEALAVVEEVRRFVSVHHLPPGTHAHTFTIEGASPVEVRCTFRIDDQREVVAILAVDPSIPASAVREDLAAGARLAATQAEVGGKHRTSVADFNQDHLRTTVGPLVRFAQDVERAVQRFVERQPVASAVALGVLVAAVVGSAWGFYLTLAACWVWQLSRPGASQGARDHGYRGRVFQEG